MKHLMELNSIKNETAYGMKKAKSSYRNEKAKGT